MDNTSGGDFFAIQTLYSRYCFAFDQNDGDAFVDCFAPGGMFQVGEACFQESAQLRAMAQHKGERPRHHYANLWVKSIVGPVAHATAYFFLIARADGAMAGYGNYEDELLCDAAGVWRFQHRRVIFQWQSDAYKARAAAVMKM
jgi:hypothetical protein